MAKIRFIRKDKKLQVIKSDKYSRIIAGIVLGFIVSSFALIIFV